VNVSDIVSSEVQARIFAALADPLRVRFVRELADGEEKTGTEIAVRIEISLALLCHHSRILVDAGVILKRKKAQTAYYKANKPLLRQAMKDLLACQNTRRRASARAHSRANAATQP
jgi:DNA-binding transcriptional ArsR family regulator